MNTVKKSIEMLVLLMKAKKKKKKMENYGVKIGDLTRLITKKSDD